MAEGRRSVLNGSRVRRSPRDRLQPIGTVDAGPQRGGRGFVIDWPCTHLGSRPLGSSNCARRLRPNYAVDE
jgi:hypothetical protein